MSLTLSQTVDSSALTFTSCLPKALGENVELSQISLGHVHSPVCAVSSWFSRFLVTYQWHPTPVLLPGKSHGWRSLVGCSPWGRTESATTERLHFHFSLSCIAEGNGNPLQCSCLENPRDGGAWWAVVSGVAQSWTRLKRLGSSNVSELFKGSMGISFPRVAFFFFFSFQVFNKPVVYHNYSLPQAAFKQLTLNVLYKCPWGKKLSLRASSEPGHIKTGLQGESFREVLGRSDNDSSLIMRLGRSSTLFCRLVAFTLLVFIVSIMKRIQTHGRKLKKESYKEQNKNYSHNPTIQE